MTGKIAFRAGRVLAIAAAVPCLLLGSHALAQAKGAPANLFANPSFEQGRDEWRIDKGGKTAASFTVDKADAARLRRSRVATAGQYSALVTIGAVEEWGTQFGQSVDAGAQGRTYTFAVLARSTRGPVSVDLQIERRGKPYDRAARSEPFTLRGEKWTELHVTFKVDKPFPEGWFAYVSCTQGGCEYRADMFRLYEGQYVPHEQAAREDAASASVSLFDTRAALGGRPRGEVLAKRAGWTRLGEDQAAHPFKGDAVFLNDKLAVVLRRGGPGAEVFATGANTPTFRALLAPAAGGKCGELSSLKIVKNTSGAVGVDAAFKTRDAKVLGLNYELTMGQPFIRTEALRGEGVTSLRVEADSRHVVLPDFFADDIVVDAADFPSREADLPGENFLLHLVGSEDAIVMGVWDKRERDVRVTLSDAGGSPAIGGCEIHYGKGGKIWVAVLEGRGIWHRHSVAKEDAGRVIRLDWKTPFPAQWRMDWRRDDKLTDSWEMIAEKRNAEFEKHGWFGDPQSIPSNRKRWTTVLGSFLYPCWVDQGGQGYVQPLKNPVRFDGPALIYPINRVKGTPLDVFTVADVARATLGVGPCEYILDLEGQGQSYKGRATCAARDALGAIYAAGQQKQKRAEVEKALDDVLVFVKHIRGRIESYVDFAHKTLAYLEEQKKAHPELAGFAAEMEPLARAVDAAVDRRRDKIKTTDYVAELTGKFRRELLDYEGEDALARCKAITEAIVVVGSNQDELVGECRLAVRILRQRAGLAMAANPRAGVIAGEIRRRTQEALRNPASHEAPRH